MMPSLASKIYNWVTSNMDVTEQTLRDYNAQKDQTDKKTNLSSSSSEDADFDRRHLPE